MNNDTDKKIKEYLVEAMRIISDTTWGFINYFDTAIEIAKMIQLEELKKIEFDDTQQNKYLSKEEEEK